MYFKFPITDSWFPQYQPDIKEFKVDILVASGGRMYDLDCLGHDFHIDALKASIKSPKGVEDRIIDGLNIKVSTDDGTVNTSTGVTDNNGDGHFVTIKGIVDFYNGLGTFSLIAGDENIQPIGIRFGGHIMSSIPNIPK